MVNQINQRRRNSQAERRKKSQHVKRQIGTKKACDRCGGSDTL